MDQKNIKKQWLKLWKKLSNKVELKKKNKLRKKNNFLKKSKKKQLQKLSK